MIATRFLTCLILIFLSCAIFANPALLPKNTPVPGGIAILHIQEKTKPTLFLNKNRIMVIGKHQNWYAIVGIPLTTTAKQIKVALKTQKGKVFIPINVNKKHYPVRRLNIPALRPSRKKTSGSQKKKKKIRFLNPNLFNHFNDTQNVHYRFSLPVKGKITSPFGLHRVLNGKYHIRHLGVDFTARRGTPIRAAAQGKVAAAGYYALTGRTVVLDHGQSLFSIYCHLNQIKTHIHQTVKRGQILGTLGSTGRATGPNLHWGVSLNGVRVNPLLFIHLTQQNLKNPKKS